jgi:hypothetical protein
MKPATDNSNLESFSSSMFVNSFESRCQVEKIEENPIREVLVTVQSQEGILLASSNYKKTVLFHLFLLIPITKIFLLKIPDHVSLIIAF